MANKVIVTRSKLDSLAESISNKSGAELPLTIAEMTYEVDNLVLNTQIIQVGSGAYLDEDNNIVFVNGDGESTTL